MDKETNLRVTGPEHAQFDREEWIQSWALDLDFCNLIPQLVSA